VAEKVETFDTKPGNRLVKWDFGNDGRGKEGQRKMETTKQPEGMDRIVGARTAHALMLVRQHSVRALLNTCDDIKVDGVGYCAGNGANLISGDGSRREEAVPDKSNN
jgi:hypothetical protein